MHRRVVITGIGMVTPLGNSRADNWDAVVAGRTGIGPITRFDASRLPCRFAGEVRNFDLRAVLDAKEVRRYDTYTHYALATTAEALSDSGLNLEAVDRERVGVVYASGIGGLGTILENEAARVEKGPGRVSPFFIPGAIINMAPGLISIRWGLKGPNYATVSACSSSGHAIADGFHIIRRGEADVMVTGGAEATILELAMAGFANAKALSTRNDEPATASRPFDATRDGFVMAEGGTTLILEDLEHALARGAHIYAEVLGAGMSGDAYHVTAPAPEGDGAVRAMRAALRSAGLDAGQVGYINAHATSTGLGDALETTAIKRVFGDHAYRLAVSSTKSMTGHLLGAAAAVETAYTALALHHGILPPTMNYREPDPACDLDYVPGAARPVQVEAALSNSFGFGGTNISLVLGRYVA